MRRNVIILLLLSFLVLGILQAEVPVQTDKKPSPILFSVSTDRNEYVLGQNVRLILTIANQIDINHTLSFRTSQQYDFIIKHEDQEVWQWSHGRFFAQALTQLHIKSHEVKIIHASWDQKDLIGQQVHPGTYTLLGILPSDMDRGRYEASLSFKITD